MFKKKFTSKEAQSVGKSDVKRLRADVLEVIGADNGDKFDLIVGKRDAVTKRKYQCASGSAAFLYSVNEIPFFVSLDRLSRDDQAVLAIDGHLSPPIIPTVFFFLRLHQLLADKTEQWSHVLHETGATAVCRGATSHFVLSGAHVMLPGILAVNAKSELVAGDVALVCSFGVEVPYAVGLVTNNMARKQDSGIGVFVVQCFKDILWQDFEHRFVTNYSLSNDAALIPPQFCDGEVLEDVGGGTVAAADQAPVGEKANENAAEPTEAVSPSESAVAHFVNEDALLTFCLCEAVKELSKSMLPLAMPQFTSLVVRSYPRDGVHTSPIAFKDTTYKKALPFFQKFPELLTITETSPGVHSVLTINKSCPMMREHNATHATFLESTHRENREKEARALQAQLLKDGTGVFKQHVVSAGVFYAAPKDLDEDLVRILLLGDTSVVPENVRFPSIEQVVSGTVPVYERAPIDEGALHELYTRKTLVDNLKAYIQAHSLLVVDGSGKGKLPTVKIDEYLSRMFSSKSNAPELPLNQVEQAMLNLLRIKHEIVLQTEVEGSALASEYLVPDRIVKSGNLPKVNVWSEKSTNNKFVTVVRNLESFGFNLDLLAHQWKKQFSSSCSVVDPALEMKNLKSGTKIPLEIRVQGNLTVKVEAALLNETNLPPSQLVSKKP